MRRILSPADLEEGCRALAAMHPRWSHAFEQCGVPDLRERGDGFHALLAAIVSQQVSVAAARAIYDRLEGAGLTDAAAITRATEDQLRAVGLSKQKARYAKALADAEIDWPGLRAAPVEEVVTTLVAVPGIGTWTAEIYAMFSLRHADVFAPGDLALQEGARLLFDMDERPKERALREWSVQWSPWRAVAARMLWDYYALRKRREGIA